MNPEKRIEISIHGQLFRLRCPEGEEEQLRATAKMVEDKITEIAEGGSLTDSVRIAQMAAFNFAYELLERREKSFRRSSEYKRIQKRLKTLIEEIDSNLSQ
ncbi:hypothetical protein AMJ85_01140 [candidate division BRC1 bacterium SM23_51]|nr:MAG: hypothetical protein AMJ85_01140 [candidate division BRC1 bacterium SM23_51]